MVNDLNRRIERLEATRRGQQGPTLRVYCGDDLLMTVNNGSTEMMNVVRLPAPMNLEQWQTQAHKKQQGQSLEFPQREIRATVNVT